MKITQTPSPNFDHRVLPISLLVLHYTGMETGATALKHMCDPKAKVSAHYMVEENGDVFQLVDENCRAWHAGVSCWAGESDINSASIGVEIVNGGHEFGLPEYAPAQIDSLIILCQGILRRHGISEIAVLGHSDIAPARKQDPGEKFPWQDLAVQGIGYWPSLSPCADGGMLAEGIAPRKNIAALQIALRQIGYDVEVTNQLDAATRLVLTALQRRYRSENIEGQIDTQMIEIILKLAERAEKSGSAASVG